MGTEIRTSTCVQTPTSCDPFSISFNDVATDAAFAFASNPGNTTFQALLDGSIVESFIASTDLTSSSNYFGFTGILFDEIHIIPGGSGGAIYDDIQFNVASVPVPAAAWLFSSGLLGLIGISRRKKAVL